MESRKRKALSYLRTELAQLPRGNSNTDFKAATRSRVCNARSEAWNGNVTWSEYWKTTRE